jgi:50S ribosome-binding GTPase
LVGGSGVGKSTLLNAIAGDQLAKTSEFRPCTSVPMVYQPPGVKLDFPGWERTTGSALEHLVIIDTPDSDTVVKEHRGLVIDALNQCDLILICGSPEKYLDEATWSLLRPLQSERTMVCVETKAVQERDSIREHWEARLKEQGFTVGGYFRVSARNTLDRKMAGGTEGNDEFGFAQLEDFFAQELTRERIHRIKRSNVSGLLTKTLGTLDERVVSHRTVLETLEKQLDEAGSHVVEDSAGIVQRRLFTESHLWAYALGREMALRAKGVVGTLYRVLEAVRGLPARLSGWLPWGTRARMGQQAAALLADKDLFNEDLLLISSEIGHVYTAKRSELHLGFAQAGFDLAPADDGLESFVDELKSRVAAVLRGPARERVVAAARRLTNWPLAILLDVPPVLFLGMSGYKIVTAYFSTVLLPGTFFAHALAVIAIILLVELLGLSILTRTAAWGVRTRAVKDLRERLTGLDIAFAPERKALSEVLAHVRCIAQLRDSVQSDDTRS